MFHFMLHQAASRCINLMIILHQRIAPSEKMGKEMMLAKLDRRSTTEGEILLMASIFAIMT